MNEKALLYSSFYDSSYSSEVLLKTYELEYETGEIEERLDINAWQMTRILRQITSTTPYKYDGIKKFTTLCYKIYGNTTVYRLILMYNGFMHPYEIASGTLIQFPDRTQLYNAVIQTTQTKKNRARSVIF